MIADVFVFAIFLIVALFCLKVVQRIVNVMVGIKNSILS